MKRPFVAATALCALALALAAAPLAAQETGQPARQPRKALLRGRQAEMAKVCALSEEQQGKIQAINAEQAKAQAELTRRFQEQVVDILTDEQKATWRKHLLKSELKGRYRNVEFSDEQLEKVLAARAKLLEGVDAGDRKAVGKANAALETTIRTEILTPDQQAELAVGSILARYRRIKITPEQQAQIKAGYVKMVEGKDLKDRKVQYKLQTDLQAMIEKEVLTDEQKLDLAVASVTAPYWRAKLTKDQIAQIRAAYTKHMGGVKTDDRKAMNEARAKLRKDIEENILTDEQREAIKPKPRPKKTQ